MKNDFDMLVDYVPFKKLEKSYWNKEDIECSIEELLESVKEHVKCKREMLDNMLKNEVELKKKMSSKDYMKMLENCRMGIARDYYWEHELEKLNKDDIVTFMLKK